MRDTKYATEIARADIGGQRIERLRIKGGGTDEIRFSWWKNGRFQTRPLDLPEDELLPLMQEAIQEQVFSENFLTDLATILANRTRTVPDDFAEDGLFDMANLDEVDTGVPGTVFVSTAIGRHGPRVKWYPGQPGRTLPCLVLSIGPAPVVRDTFLPDRITRPVLPRLMSWVASNHVALLRFWTEGDTWNRRTVANFLEGLVRAPADD